MKRPFTSYFNGLGEVLYSDPIAKILWEGETNLEEAIHIEKFSVHDLESAIREQHLYPFDLNSPRVQLFLKNHAFPYPLDPDYQEDWLAAIHDDRGTYPPFIGNSGKLRGERAPKLAELIREFEPGWTKIRKF